MIEVGGNIFYVDLDALDSFLTNDDSLLAKEVVETDLKEFKDESGAVINSELTTRRYQKGKEVDGARFEMINFMLQIVMSDTESNDYTLGFERAMSDKPLSYTIALNTLMKVGVLKVFEK